MKRTRTAAVVIALLMLAGCTGGSDGDAAESGSDAPAPDRTAAEEPTDATDGPPPRVTRNLGSKALRVGQPWQGPWGTTSVRDVSDPFPAKPHRGAEPGKRWIGVLVTTCFTNDAPPDAVAMSWQDWAAVDRTGSVYPSSSMSWDDYPLPQYPTAADGRPGRCYRGWLLLTLQDDVQARLVRYSPGGASVAEWRM